MNRLVLLVLSIAHYAPGDADVLEIIDRPIPEPGPGEVRVRIIVAGVNPTDIDARKARAGHVRRFREPHVPGQDGAGTIDALGAGVSARAIGQPVWVWEAAWRRHEGTSQQYVVLPARQAVPLPDTDSFDIGASLGIPALTAHRALTSFAEGPTQLEPGALKGRLVMVSGGAGAVGHAAIQLARWAGAEVVATVSDERKARLARAAGADHVLNYHEADLREAIRQLRPRGPDVIVEVNARANLPTDMSVIAAGGGISIYTGGSETKMPSYQAMSKNVQVSFILTYTTTDSQKTAAVAAVARAVEDGALGVGEAHGLPLTRFEFAHAADAHRAVESHTTGKVLIDVQSTGTRDGEVEW